MRLLTNTKAVLAGVFAAPALFATYSVRVNDWTWFARSGGLILILGGLLATRKLIRVGVSDLFEETQLISGGGPAPTPGELEAARQIMLDIVSAKRAFWVIPLGTLVCSFGDIVGRAIFDLFL